MAAVTTMEYDFKPSLKVVAGNYKDLDEAIQDFREPLKECINKVVIPSIKANFAAEGRPSWAPYAESTINFHKILNAAMSEALLVHSGRLRSTMSSPALWTVTKDEAYIASLPGAIWYGAVHQGGYSGGNSNGPIPARPFVLLQPSEEAKLDEIFYDWLGREIDKTWPER